MTRHAVIAAAVATALPGTAWGHAAERAVVLLLPTGHWMVAGAVAVAASFVLLVLVPGRWLRRAFARHRLFRRRRLPAGPAVSALSALAFLGLVASGYLGSRDPLRNPLPLAVWTLFWVGLVLASAAFGDLWRWLNPWSAPMWLLRRAGLRPVLRPGRRLGQWPAILWLAGFAWFQLVHPAPDDPARLADAVLTYWAATLAAMILFGEGAWRRRGECFAILIRLVARLAPVRSHPHGRRIRVTGAIPGAGAAAPPAPSVTEALLLIFALASVTFDGLADTFRWLALAGVNPLEFPGRSAVIGINTAGLLLAWAALAGAITLTVAAEHALAGRRGSFRARFTQLSLSLVPIALGYHLAHYLTQILIQGQYITTLASDPLGTGADLLGLGPHFVTTSFLHDRGAVEAIWNFQAGTIIAAHVLAVAVARRIALDLPVRAGLLAELPLAALMVLYTLLGLWLLAAPAI